MCIYISLFLSRSRFLAQAQPQHIASPSFCQVDNECSWYKPGNFGVKKSAVPPAASERKGGNSNGFKDGYI